MVIPTIRRWRQKDLKFEASLKTNKKQQQDRARNKIFEQSGKCHR
jgi:hypothetical protein